MFGKIIHLAVCLAFPALIGAAAPLEIDTLTEHGVTMILTAAGHPVADPDGGMTVPPPLKDGDIVAVVSPSGEAHDTDFQAITRTLEDQGWRVRIGEHAAGRNGTYSGSRQQRLSDLSAALTDPEVKAVICTRGGYGAVHLLEDLAELPLSDNPKWLVGFSDISALHALMNSNGIASIHGPMGINMTSPEHISNSCRALFDILKGYGMKYEVDTHPYNRNGVVEATLTGGNLAVIDGLASTPFDCFRPGSVLFIEDVSEPIYKIERMLYRLKLSGVLDMLGGLIVGAFTDVAPDHNYASMECMIRDMVAEYDFPVAFGIPAGHVKVNVPLILGAPVRLEVTDRATVITQ